MSALTLTPADTEAMWRARWALCEFLRRYDPMRGEVLATTAVTRAFADILASSPADATLIEALNDDLAGTPWMIVRRRPN